MIYSLNRYITWGVTIPLRVLAVDCLGHSRVGSLSLVDFICMCLSVISDLPVLLGKKIVCKDHMDIM